MSNSSELFDYIHACIPNVTGVCHTFKETKGKQTNQFGLTIFVKKKRPRISLSNKELIPSTIEGQPTDVVEMEVRALALRTDEWRPAPGGVSLGHPQVTAGTLGGWLYHGNDIVLLTNNHIAANCNNAEIGDPTYQPGVYDGGGAGNTLALLGGFKLVDFIGGDNEIDAAFSKVIDVANVDWSILGITTAAIKYKVIATISMPVTKSGRTTAITEGIIGSLDWAGLVNYGTPGLAKYIKQIYIPTLGFISGGDSGSWVLQLKEGTEPDTVTGLVFAGDQAGRCIANHITPVFQELDIGIAPPSTVEGTVTLGGGIITGAQVICANLTTEELSIRISDSEGKYSFEGVAHNAETVLLASHFEYGDKVYQKCYYKKVMSDPATQDIVLEEYDALSNGRELNFVFTGGTNWLELNLNLQSYFGVWR